VTRPLILFDIDGTLVRKAGGHHRRALEEAALRVTGMHATTEGVPTQGMLDRDILRLMLRNAGLSERRITEHMPELIRAAENIYIRRGGPNLHRKVCPGARMLLYRLSRRPTTRALVTGNLSRIGWEKIRRAGLKDYFQYGAFAELAKDRAGLVKLAIAEARRRGSIDRHSPITLIGDHENDIRAARANDIRIVSVATGISTYDELALEKPDILVPDLRALDWETLFHQ
jgi:phosphoglycolate phosphatase-like HAD superfamily hydrolase